LKFIRVLGEIKKRLKTAIITTNHYTDIVVRDLEQYGETHGSPADVKEVWLQDLWDRVSDGDPDVGVFRLDDSDFFSQAY
jgi:hypothetical protein